MMLVGFPFNKKKKEDIKEIKYNIKKENFTFDISLFFDIKKTLLLDSLRYLPKLSNKVRNYSAPDQFSIPSNAFPQIKKLLIPVLKNVEKDIQKDYSDFHIYELNVTHCFFKKIDQNYFNVEIVLNGWVNA